MNRIRPPTMLLLLGPACALVLLLACFHAVLFRGEQFAYRDAAHFYYPLHLRVQQEWSAHRWPLWDPGQNAGVPLLGMPMAAVFYPGKLLFALLAYPWATRLYSIAHVALAWTGMFLLARAWERSPTAAGLAALAYAFGAPVLFQYCNVIYLVGAAWVPWGFLALEWSLRQRRRWGVLALAVVLALQVLGGDPEAAYLTVLSGGGYALVLARALDARNGSRFEPEHDPLQPPLLKGGRSPRRPSRVSSSPPYEGGVGGGSSSGRRSRFGRRCAVGLFVWVAASLLVAYALPRIPLPPWLPLGWIIPCLAWGFIVRWLVRYRPMLRALIGASALAVLLTAVQLLPVLEYAQSTLRAADDRPGRIYGFCVEPYRLIEAAWPSAFGGDGPENHSWLQAVPPVGQRLVWTPSLYLGGLTLVLALGGFGFRDGPPWRVWLSGVALVAVAASLGRFGGPLWMVRWLPGVPAILGHHDPGTGVERIDEWLPDGTGSVYGLLAAVLPGFTLFRYPAKLLTFAAVAVAALAGLGWDRLAAGAVRGTPARSSAGLVATLLALATLLATRGAMVSWLGHHLPADAEFGPFDPSAALASTVRSLAHGGLVFAMALFLAAWAPRRPGWAGALALIAMTLDLGVANAPLVWTIPQADFETPSRARELIQAAERAQPSPGPYRVQRMEMLFPALSRPGAAGRSLRESIAWQRDTLQPFFGIPQGIEDTYVQGLLESDEYAAFFASQLATPRDPSGATTEPPVYTFPRRGFDLWDSRYLIMAVRNNGWVEAKAGFDRLYPPDDVVADPEKSRRWIEGENWQLLRNRVAYPRAWLVHFVHIRPPIRGRSDPEYLDLMQDLVYQANAAWRVPGRPLYDPRVVAFVETDRREGLVGYASPTEPGAGEKVTITHYDPQRVELRAVLDRPGLVILADVFYPGWSLTIDGAPAPIYRTNRLMRGAAVKAGVHQLVYTYDPASFRVGGVLSCGGLLTLLALIPWTIRPRRESRP